jgi:hypothetical protein
VKENLSSEIPQLRIPILPEWDPESPYFQWANSFVWKNHWRVKYYMGGDVDDLMSECGFMWIQCCKAYGGSVDTPQQMMYMYQRWITGQFHDYSTKDTKIRSVCEKLAYRTNVAQAECDFTLKMNEASYDLKRVLDIFLNAPIEIMEVLKEDTKGWTSKKFFRKVVVYLHIDEKRTSSLVKELETLLS